MNDTPETDSATTPTLLLVDDEPNILSSLRRLFRPQGYRIFIAESGAEGLEILARETVDLVVSDMRMPEMDGATFLKEVRQRRPETMRILLTGYADVSSTVAAINEGEIYRYVAKPWNDSEMIEVVRDALEHGRLRAENRRLTALTQRQNAELKGLNAGLEQKVAERTAELKQALSFVEQANSDLKKSFLTIVQVFAGLIELRSGPTGSQLSGHGRRVADLARQAAQRLGLNEIDTQNVIFAALLHDIGKIGLPDELLTRPFNLLNQEHRTTVMKHPVIGQNILMAVERLKDAATLVRHHHECFDGSGFPDRLVGMAIPLGSRILAAANDYDALQIGTLVQRPLRPSEALTFLVDNRGKRYDPQVVDVLAEIIEASRTSTFEEVPVRATLLRPGMILARDFHHRDGYLLLAKACALTADMIGQLQKMEATEQFKITLWIRQEVA
ncbi:MAG TPA: HD domain-containing phosphohydrolase [Azospira sp.]|nr:HD domain-containing phosphohydrolase [Azospira sp.]